MRFKIRIVHEWEYEVNPESYGTKDVQLMLNIDICNAREDTELFLSMCPHSPEISIKEVDESQEV